PLPVGKNVTLFSQAGVSVGAWMFNTTMIVMIFPGNEIISNDWRNRLISNTTTNYSSLTITSMRVEDSGVYTLQDVNLFQAQLTLSVQAGNVIVPALSTIANPANLVEYNDTAILSCSVSNGSSLSYVWLNGSSVVTASGDVQLSDGGATLTLVSITHNNEGPFRCNVSNGISNEISPPVHLNISYGPRNTTMMIMPMEYIHRTGSNITLSCSAASSPPAKIQWMVDGVSLNMFGPQLQLMGVKEKASGNYQCLFHNTVTSRFATATAMIRIQGKIFFVIVSVDFSLKMHCAVTGSVDSIHWFRNGQLISPDNRTLFEDGNKTVIINLVQLSDEGDYQCQAFNYVSNVTSSPYRVQVNYGPMNPVITEPSMALTGTYKILNCSWASHPPSHISWYFGDSLVANTSNLTIGPLTLNMSGKYICMAFNNVTGKNSTAYTMLTVLAPVTKASIKIVGSQPILNHTFTLACETAGMVESITWTHGQFPLYADNTRNLSMDNTTLTFDPVMKSDNGHYQCVASNPLSMLTSEIFMLNVFYGPEMPVIMGPNLAKTGDNVTLSCSAPSNPPGIYKWLFNGSVVANTSVYITPPFTSDMSGMYTCVVYNNITGENKSLIDLALEGNYYNLTCNVTGHAEHVYWMKNDELLHEDNRIVFSMDNKTVIFNPLDHNDTGYYQCKAINSLSNLTSTPHKLLVNYGPETAVIDGPAFAEIGQAAVFNCSAESIPPSQFSWWFNGLEVANSSVFITDSLTFNMSGVYTCVAFNDVTGKNTTISRMLTVIEAIESVMIRNNTVPINSANFTLTCEVTGPYDRIDWMIDNAYHKANTSMAGAGISYHIENNTIHFTPVTISHDGTYKCIVTNLAGVHKSPPYVLLVNYGPLSVNIDGPYVAPASSTVSLTCSADSRPDCDFCWYINNQALVLKTGPVITFPATEENVGTYICMATFLLSPYI
uniref:Ig-like domain-containing protein n=1 Tax=Mola mola TaxID=94237 RepID=A0A3Q3XCZ4_MOLML